MLGLFGGGAKAPVSSEPVSVLAGWKDYEASSVDPEAGLLPSAAAISGRIGAAASRVQASASAAATSAVSVVPSSNSFQLALGFFLAGGALQFIALFVALPVVILSPSKFALSFTLGNACILSGAASLTGLRASLEHAFDAGRAPMSAAYLASALATLWAALVAHSYLLSLLCSGLQVGALSMLVASYVPGGTSGLKMLAGSAFGAARGIAAGLISK